MNKEKSGALFKNDKKTSDKAPEYTGTIMIEGISYRLAAWLNTSQKGLKYMSLAASIPKPKDQSNQRADYQQPQQQDEQQQQEAFIDDDIPF